MNELINRSDIAIGDVIHIDGDGIRYNVNAVTKDKIGIAFIGGFHENDGVDSWVRKDHLKTVILCGRRK
jgi:hypothetical protein